MPAHDGEITLQLAQRTSGPQQTVANFVYRRQFTVEWRLCDPAGIMFNSRFFELFDVSAWLLFETALGVPKHELAGTFDICGIPLVDARSRFIAPARFGDLVDIESEIAEFRRSSFDIDHRLSIAGAPVAEGRETRVWAQWDIGDPPRLRSKPVPGDVVARFRMA